MHLRLKKLLLFSIILASCNSKKEWSPSFKEFEFYYDDTWSSAFSLKFTQTDTVYIRQYFVANRYYRVDSLLKNNTSYIGLLHQEQRDTLNRLLQYANFSRYDSSYMDFSLEDGTMLKFFLTTDSLSKNVVIYGDNAPLELLQLGEWIAEMKKHVKLLPIDTVIPFLHKEILPPEVDLKKFTTPSI